MYDHDKFIADHVQCLQMFSNIKYVAITWGLMQVKISQHQNKLITQLYNLNLTLFRGFNKFILHKERFYHKNTAHSGAITWAHTFPTVPSHYFSMSYWLTFCHPLTSLWWISYPVIYLYIINGQIVLCILKKQSHLIWLFLEFFIILTHFFPRS